MIFPFESYNQWWTHPFQSPEDFEFAALLLRLCSYSAQFHPRITLLTLFKERPYSSSVSNAMQQPFCRTSMFEKTSGDVQNQSFCDHLHTAASDDDHSNRTTGGTVIF